jgi:hypothetical protein
MSRRQIFMIKIKKAQRCKINIEKEHGGFLYWFMSSQRVIALCPVSLYYAIKFDALIDCGLLLL